MSISHSTTKYFHGLLYSSSFRGLHTFNYCPSAAPQSNNVIMVIHPWPGRRWIFTIGGSSSSAHHYNRNRWGHVCLVPSITFLLNFDAPMSCCGTDGWAANQVNGALMVFIFICPTFIRLYYEHVVRCGTKQLR